MRHRSTLFSTTIGLTAAFCAVSLGLTSALAATPNPITSSAATPAAGTTPAASPILRPGDPDVDSTRILALIKGQPTEADLVQAAQRAGLSAKLPVVGRLLTLQTLNNSDPNKAAASLVSSGLFEAVDFEGISQPLAYSETPNDPRFAGDSTAYGLLDKTGGSSFNKAWPLLNSAEPANFAPIAVLDDGVDLNHEDRAVNLQAGWNTADNTSQVAPPDTSGQAGQGHGTAVAGLIGAATDNSRGIAGAAWDNQVVVYKVMSQNQTRAGFADSAVVQAIDRAISDSRRVILLPLGRVTFSAVVKAAIDRAIAHGLIVVASAGNGGAGSVVYPAAYGPVLSVGATNQQGEWAKWASANQSVNLAAAGESVGVLAPGSRYATATGTSMSASYVAAAAALIWRTRSELTARQVESVLKDGATDVTTSPATAGRDDYTGAGLLNVNASAVLAKNLPASVHIDPAKTDFALTAGQPFDVALNVVGGAAANLKVASGTLPDGVKLVNRSGKWFLNGTPTKTGSHEPVISVDGGTGIALTLNVKPATIASLTVKPNAAAVWAADGATWQTSGLDKYGNAITDLVSGGKLTATPQNCRFATGQAPSRRTCQANFNYAGQYGKLTAAASTEVFDATALAPVINGTARIGKKLTVTKPAGWPAVKLRWISNGKTVSTQDSLLLKDARKGDKINAETTFEYKGLKLVKATKAVTV
ncbi:MAG: S8 family serine peptidase, partial [Bifidobacteriaceae bacterium]|nr:S8 family serine peptidase [Bifidobacteriaceae bacterium]